MGIEQDMTSTNEADEAKSQLFFESWIKCGGNATEAYKKLHPKVTEASARVLGSRELAKVNIKDLLGSVGLTHDTYLRKLSEGLNAEKVISVKYWEAKNVEDRFKCEIAVPDHVARLKYLNILGRLLGVDREPVGTQVNIVNAIQNNLNKPDN